MAYGFHKELIKRDNKNWGSFKGPQSQPCCRIKLNLSALCMLFAYLRLLDLSYANFNKVWRNERHGIELEMKKIEYVSHIFFEKAQQRFANFVASVSSMHALDDSSVAYLTCK